jgi:aryl-alcohol dehydrogenase-like predicted oxidoreductase
MQFKRFGETGLFVSRLCLGTMTFGGKGFWEVIGHLGQDMATRIVDRCLDAGINALGIPAVDDIKTGTRPASR